MVVNSHYGGEKEYHDGVVWCGVVWCEVVW